MKGFIDFISAALPWICIGLLLAVFFARSAKRKKDDNKAENFGPEGMCLGMSLGTAIGSSLGSVGIGITLGMLAGLVIGSCIEKKEKPCD